MNNKFFVQVKIKEPLTSIFPKNWNLERIQQEVAFVYENTVARGLGKRPKSVDDVLEKYIGECTSEFDILIEVDEFNRIVNAYPK